MPNSYMKLFGGFTRIRATFVISPDILRESRYRRPFSAFTALNEFVYHAVTFMESRKLTKVHLRSRERSTGAPPNGVSASELINNHPPVPNSGGWCDIGLSVGDRVVCAEARGEVGVVEEFSPSGEVLVCLQSGRTRMVRSTLFRVSQSSRSTDGRGALDGWIPSLAPANPPLRKLKYPHKEFSLSHGDTLRAPPTEQRPAQLADVHFRSNGLLAIMDAPIWSDSQLALVPSPDPCDLQIHTTGAASRWWWSSVWKRHLNRHRITSLTPSPPSLCSKLRAKYRREIRKQREISLDATESPLNIITLDDLDPHVPGVCGSVYGRRTKWKLLRSSGYHAFGVRIDGRPVFVKILNNWAQARCDFVRLRHTNVVTVFSLDIFQSSERVLSPVLVQGQCLLLYSEILCSFSVKDIIARANYSPLPLPFITVCMRQVCDALIFLHSHSVNHGRLTARNIFVSDCMNHFKLTDYGLPAPRSPSGSIRADLLPFSSPEQIIDPHTPILNSDIWMMGTLLVELATGREPKWGSSDDPIQIAHTIAIDTECGRPADRLVLPAVAPAVVDLIGRCLVYEIRSRPSIRDFQHLLV